MTARPFKIPALTGRPPGFGVGEIRGDALGDGRGVGRVLVGVGSVLVSKLGALLAFPLGDGVGVGDLDGVGEGDFKLAFALAFAFVFVLEFELTL